MVWTLSKSKPFFCKAFVKNMKRQVRDWAKMFASHISDKGQEPRLYKDVSKFKNKTNE